jgi:fibronectin type 3 domain-containing protein
VPPAAAAGSDAGAPSTVTARSTSASAIQLQWAPVDGAARYDVERSTDTLTWDVVASTTSDQTHYTDAALASGTTYYYRVAAVAGEAVSRSDVISATTTVDTPDAPVLLSATSSATSVDLTWSDVAGELSYQVQRSPDGINGWTDIGTTGQDVTSYTDTGLAATTTYYYRVVAVTSNGGVSAPSGVLPATAGPGDLSGGPSTSNANADPSIAPTAP